MDQASLSATGDDVSMTFSKVSRQLQQPPKDNSSKLPFQLLPAEILAIQAHFPSKLFIPSASTASADGHVAEVHKTSVYLTNFRIFVEFARNRLARNVTFPCLKQQSKNQSSVADHKTTVIAAAGAAAATIVEKTNSQKTQAIDYESGSSTFYNIILRCIDWVELRDIFYLYIFCKDGRLAKVAFDNNENCTNWLKLINEAAMPRQSLRDLFAFSFYEQCQRTTSNKSQKILVSEDLNDYALTSGVGAANGDSLPFGAGDADTFDVVRREFDRLRFDSKFWRIADLNSRQGGYRLSPTYPKFWVVPARLTDDELESAARHRSLRRTAAVVWRHPINGAVLVRCSQPESGLFGWRSSSDEYLLQCIREAACSDSPKFSRKANVVVDWSTTTKAPETDFNESTVEDQVQDVSSTPPMLVLDARSYTAAWANRAKGGGFENKENYQNCEIQFLGLANIHAVRYSFQKLRALLWDSNGSGASRSNGSTNGQTLTNDYYYETGYFQNLDASQWPQHLWILLNSSSKVVDALHRQGRCVLVHCSDGWDRTTQIISLAKLMLDPYYRTLDGFKELIEREWIAFGHKFSERCGLLANGDPNQRAPVFLQWLDCVRYLQREFPCSFEFNDIYLLKLAQHVYSGLFGTFLCNTVRDFDQETITQRTFSLWSYLNDPDRYNFRNLLYDGIRLKNFSNNSYSSSSKGYCSSRESSKSPPAFSNANCINNNKDYGPVVLIVRPQIRDLATIWRALYCPYDDPANQNRVTSSFGTAGYYDWSAASLDDSAVLMNQNVEKQHHVTRTHSYGDLFESNMQDSKMLNAAKASTTEAPDQSNCRSISPFSSLHRSTSEFSLQQILQKDQQKTPQNDENLGAKSRRSSVDDLDLLGGAAVRFCRRRRRSSSSNQEEEEKRAEKIGLLFKVPNNFGDTLQYKRAPVHGLLTADVDNSNVNKQANNAGTSTSDLQDNGGNSSNSMLISKRREMGIVKNCTPQIFETYCNSDDGNFDNNTSNEGGKNCRIQHHPMITLDVDGLKTVTDQVQRRIQQIIRDYEKRLDSGQMEIERLKILIARQQVDNQRATYFGVPDNDKNENDTFEPNSFDSRASDASWEAIMEDRNEINRPVLWTPDHAAVRCANCQAQFWAIKRRHHCRNCGKVFCSACTNYECPVPQEQFFRPVRVCIKCYERLSVEQDD